MLGDTRLPRRQRRARTLVGGVALLAATALALSGCTSADAPAGQAPSQGSSASPAADLTLKIGTLLPQSGGLAFQGPAQEAGVALAVKDINEADMGITIDVAYRDSGDTTTDTSNIALTDLLGDGATAIVGTASSGLTLSLIDRVADAGVLMMSPAASSPKLSDYPDKGLLWRTAPSDVLQGEVLGTTIAADGHSTLGMVVLNDPFGTSLAEVVKENFEAAGGKVVSQALFNEGDSSFDAQISEVTAAKPDAIALITFEQVKIIVPKLVSGGFPSENLYFVDANLADYSAELAPGLLTGAKGTKGSPLVDTGFNDRLLELDPSLTDFAYAAESYDAVVVIALAALAANDTTGNGMASKLQEVSGGSGGGTKANSFVDAAKIIRDGGVVDYDGASGPISFGDNGDITEANIEIFQYKDDNTYALWEG
ncbi:ABC transporter substrate-binding protein [Homoserinimonas sp. OAct 916]|uniref:ABC transporter substrate-binding protein n=1 Tax=Homoserinimonas sp. OAct 916 TaxID=2211450 RepID=UPI000DBE1099|nr:ABC transporter substrate-binding protein [Homoserinimonas sp. OAct 916]